MRQIVVRAQSVSPPRYQVPPVQAYEDWCQEYWQQHPTTARQTPRPAILRRIAMLRQAGDSWAEIARCCGLSWGGAKDAYERLPLSLRGG